jgi:hypothetical protein
VIVSDWSGGEGGRPVILIGGLDLPGGAFLSLLDSSFSCVGLSLYVILSVKSLVYDGNSFYSIFLVKLTVKK